MHVKLSLTPACILRVSSVRQVLSLDEPSLLSLGAVPLYLANLPCSEVYFHVESPAFLGLWLQGASFTSFTLSAHF